MRSIHSCTTRGLAAALAGVALAGCGGAASQPAPPAAVSTTSPAATPSTGATGPTGSAGPATPAGSPPAEPPTAAPPVAAPPTSTSPAGTSPAAASPPVTSASATGQQLGGLSFRVPETWQRIDIKAPDLLAQLERLQLPPEDRQVVLDQLPGFGQYDEVFMYLDPKALTAGTLVVARQTGTTDPTSADLERAAKAAAGSPLGSVKPTSRRTRIAGREAAVVSADVPAGGERVVSRQVFLNGRREAFLMAYVAVDRSAATPAGERRFEEIFRSFRYTSLG